MNSRLVGAWAWLERQAPGRRLLFSVALLLPGCFEDGDPPSADEADEVEASSGGAEDPGSAGGDSDPPPPGDSTSGDGSTTAEPPGSECEEGRPWQCGWYQCQEIACVNGYCQYGEDLPDGTQCSYSDDQEYPGFCHSGFCAYDCSDDPEDPNYGWCGDATACTVPICELGQCKGDALLDNVEADEEFQASGDCTAIRCVQGEPTEVIDEFDPFDDGNPCTADTCEGRTPLHTPLPAGEPCGIAGSCDVDGNCIERP